MLSTLKNEGQRMPKNIIDIIAEYAFEYTDFQNWVDEKKINWKMLNANPNALFILDKHPDKLNWHMLSYNPSAIHLLENNFQKINWLGLKYCM